jgi:two-component system, OmpR family, sensor histidine kinase BaeS
MSRRLLASLAVSVVVSVVLAELLLSPPSDDRIHLLAILATPALVALIVTPLVARWVSTRSSVAGAALAVALCSLILGAATSSAASNAMFVSSHDFRLFIVLLVLSSGIAVAVGSQLTRPLARDIRRLGHVAEEVAAGDLSVQTGIDRNDEVGITARAVDRMVDTLAHAEDERARLTSARRHLLTSIGHDVRTPLAAMRAAVEILEDGLAPDPERYLGVIASQIATVDSLLDQLIEFARLESGQTSVLRERLSVAELADECAETFALLAARRDIELRVESSGPGIVLAHPVEIPRVVRNLVDNAIRHAPEGSTVTIVVCDTPQSVELRVDDDGDGFPDDFREHAFEPFTRADMSRNARTGNTGLGLAICKAIIEAHHGRIWLGPGPGAHVHCSLPTPEET